MSLVALNESNIPRSPDRRVRRGANATHISPVSTKSSRTSSLASTIRLWLTAPPRQAAASGRTVSATLATAARKTWRDDFAYQAGVRSCRRAQPATDAAERCPRHVCRHWHNPARSRVRTAHDDRPGRTLFRATVPQLSPNLTFENYRPDDQNVTFDQKRCGSWSQHSARSPASAYPF
jgi:hypothetical protein